ncbi:cell division protein FtsZ [Bartonella sp. HY329]|uniref:cell division protein FtsZ n=1 Tax=unclassified Bartonella TaxID=2645622 RepID=UPI0021C85C88|nr:MULTISPECIES: cell division protein FtsZ [unclassified Bartonella]UXM94544.1 cell division protein FtsZ [Bartonella sp. HY329]UXN08868.1 cell division protein FtsZ [Bartonella sp. HY328]
MSITLQRPEIVELKPKITVFGVGGGGGNAVNNMINAGLEGVEFVVANTDAQALAMSRAEKVVQLGASVTEGLGAGARPEVGQSAAEESLDEILDHLNSSHMVFVTAGMGGGTGTGAAPIIARAAREKGLLTVGVVTKPFSFEGQRRMKTAEAGIEELQKSVDTLIVIPNQNLFRIANEKTTFADAFAMADQVLYSGVASITDLMIRKGLINLDFADVRSVMHDMGKAMMGTGEASGEGRALKAAEAAIANPLLDETSMRGARGLLVSVSGGSDLTLFEVDEAVNRIKEEVDADANIIFGAINDEALEGIIRVSVVATGIDRAALEAGLTIENSTSVHAVKKLEAAAPVVTRPVQPQTESFREVIEALEEEMAAPMEEPFRPQSQIFASAQPAAPNRVVGQPNIAKQPVRSAAPLQPMGQTAATPPSVDTVAPTRSAAPASQNFSQSLAPQQGNMQGQQRSAAPQQQRMQGQQTQQQPMQQASSRIPEIEAFPPSLRINADQKSKGNSEGNTPRSLWQRLKQGFIHRDEEEPSARLEPAVNIAAKQNVPQRSSGQNAQQNQMGQRPNMGDNRQVPNQDQAIYTPRRPNEAQMRPQQQRAEAPSEDEQLEIPAFLRRQAN